MTTEASTPALAAGDMLDGRIRLVELLAEGGMGTVWAGHNDSLDLPVAVKLMRPELMLRPVLVERMIDEARAAARLHHPAIVRVFDVGRHTSGVPFIVMELLKGQTLAQAMVARGSVPAQRGVRCLLPIASALAFAHDHHVIHRDMKPENVILAELPNGALQPKLVDFGMAKAEFTGNKSITGIGTALGTPRYMSPEQAQGSLPTASVDVWSFCVVLYELIAGRAPFDQESLPQLINAICSHKPDSLVGAGGCDHELWPIIERGLAKQPGDRWPSMRDLGEALAFWLLANGVAHDVSGRTIADDWAPAPSGPRDAFDSDPPADSVSAAWRARVERASLGGQRPAIDSAPAGPAAPEPSPPAVPELELDLGAADRAGEAPARPAPGVSQRTPVDSLPRRSRWSEVDDRLMAEVAAEALRAKDGTDASKDQPKPPKLPLIGRPMRTYVTTEPSSGVAKTADVRAMLLAADTAYTAGQHQRAYELASQALDAAKTDESAAEVNASWPRLERILHDGLGGADARIEVGSMWGWPLSPAEAYVASRIHHLTVADAVDATGIDPQAALRTICWLHRLGLVRTTTSG